MALDGRWFICLAITNDIISLEVAFMICFCSLIDVELCRMLKLGFFCRYFSDASSTSMHCRNRVRYLLSGTHADVFRLCINSKDSHE